MCRTIVGISANLCPVDEAGKNIHTSVSRKFVDGVRMVGGLPMVILVGDKSLVQDYVEMIDKLILAHVVSYRGELYLETGLHRALRAALQGRTFIHAWVLELGDSGVVLLAPLPPETGGNSTRNRRN